MYALTSDFLREKELLDMPYSSEHWPGKFCQSKKASKHIVDNRHVRRECKKGPGWGLEPPWHLVFSNAICLHDACLIGSQCCCLHRAAAYCPSRTMRGRTLSPASAPSCSPTCPIIDSTPRSHTLFVSYHCTKTVHFVLCTEHALLQFLTRHSWCVPATSAASCVPVQMCLIRTPTLMWALMGMHARLV